MKESLETHYEMLCVAYKEECANHDKFRVENKKLKKQVEVLRAFAKDMYKCYPALCDECNKQATVNTECCLLEVLAAADKL